MPCNGEVRRIRAPLTNSLTDFAFGLINDLPSTVQRIENRIAAACTAYDGAFNAITTALSIAAASVARVEALAHADTIETELAAHQRILLDVDADALAAVYCRAREGYVAARNAAGGEGGADPLGEYEAVKKHFAAVKKGFVDWEVGVGEDYQPKSLREEVEREFRFVKSLAEDMEEGEIMQGKEDFDREMED